MSQFNQTTHTTCPNLNGCKVWEQFKTNNKLFWIKQYCEGEKQAKCARLQLNSQGKVVPDNLLPNGDTLA